MDGCQAARFSVIGNEEAVQLAPDHYCYGLRLAKVLAQRISRTGELIAQYADVLELGLIRE